MEDPPKKFECWIPHKWRFEHPWKRYQGTYRVPSDLKTFTFTHIAHATHTEEKKGIVDKEGIKAKRRVIEKKAGYSYQQLVQKPKPLTEDKVFPGYYVSFAPIIPELDSKQKKACRKLTERFGQGFGKTEFSDYIEHCSRYGNRMFSMTIDEALKLYKYSVEQKTKKRVEEIKFKLMGTKRYNSSALYTVAVTARLEGEEKDPLHEYQDWDQHDIASLYRHHGEVSEESSDSETGEKESDSEIEDESPPPKKKKLEASEGTQSHDQAGPSHVTRTKIVFNPKAVVCIPKKQYYTRDYIEIVFHFRKRNSFFNLKIKSPKLDRSQPKKLSHYMCMRELRDRETCTEKDPEEKRKTNQRKRFK